MPTQQTAIIGVSRHITAGQEFKAGLCRALGVVVAGYPRFFGEGRKYYALPIGTGRPFCTGACSRTSTRSAGPADRRRAQGRRSRRDGLPGRTAEPGSGQYLRSARPGQTPPRAGPGGVHRRAGAASGRGEPPPPVPGGKRPHAADPAFRSCPAAPATCCIGTGSAPKRTLGLPRGRGRPAPAAGTDDRTAARQDPRRGHAPGGSRGGAGIAATNPPETLDCIPLIHVCRRYTEREMIPHPRTETP